MSKSQKPSVAEDEEDDVDDLDDLIPSVTEKLHPQLSPSLKASSSTSKPAVEAEEDEDLDDDDFEAALAKEMEEMLMGITSPGLRSASDASTSKEEKDMKEAWDRIFAQNGVELPAGTPSGSKTANRAGESDFQRKIRETQERLKRSDTKAQGSGSTGVPGIDPSDPLYSLLSALGGAEGAGDVDEETAAGVLESLMEGLMGKEVLYEPLKELGEKYPAYLDSPPADLAPETLEQYRKQYGYVKDIVALFEQKDYSDDNEVMRERVRSLMTRMQDCGSPPDTIMGEMPDGWDLGGLGAGLPGMDGEACCVM